MHKSHPEVFFECMSRLGGADPAACAVCEDAVYAAATAHKAGYYVIGIADRTSAADEPEMRRICSQFVPRWDALDWTRVRKRAAACGSFLYLILLCSCILCARRV